VPKLLASLAALLAAAGLSASAASARAATAYFDSFAGIEVPPITSTLGTFTGVASGQLPGGWYAQIRHVELSPTGDPVDITGGTFTFKPILRSAFSEAVTGGTVTPVNLGAGCTNQTFAIQAQLADGGSFDGTLTHYRVSLFGTCIVYSASIVGHGTIEH
jgi:hypothetical protein